MTPDERADQDIHEANLRADAACDTLRGSILSTLRAQLADVPEAFPGETFDSVESEVLYARLRTIRQTLRSAGFAL